MPMTMTPTSRRLRSRASQSSYRGYVGTEKPSPRSSDNPEPNPTTASPSGVPRTVTPNSSSQSGSNWENFGAGFYGSNNKAQRNMDRSLNSTASTITSFEEEDMPMDEMMSVGRSVSRERDYSMASPPTNTNRMILALKSHSGVRPDGLSKDEQRLWDAFHDAMNKVTARSDPKASPATVSPEEPAAGAHSPTFPASAATKRINQLEEQLREERTKLRTQEEEHDTEVRAIQRVLAEITSENEEEVQVLTDTVATLSNKVTALETQRTEAWKNSSSAPPPPPPPTPPASATALKISTAKASTPEAFKQEIAKLKTNLKEVEAQKLSFKKEIDRKSRRLIVLERDFKVAKTQLRRYEDASSEPKDVVALLKEVEELRVRLDEQQESNKKLRAELEGAGRKTKRKPVSMTPPRPDSTSTADTESVSSAISAEEVESLQKSLTDTTSSLENAKMIIASLENANGSMAVDLRAKLKAKEEELHMVQMESSERKRRLDSLATELRDLQKQQDDVDRLERQSKAQIVRHKALMGLLERSVSGLQSASVVHEVSTSTGQADQGNVDQIAEILSDTMIGMRSSLELSEQYMDEFDDTSTVAFTDVDVASDVGRQIDAIIKNDREALAKNLADELEQKRATVVRLETTLQKQSEELNRVKNAGTNEELVAEIQSLRDQCSTNMEVLAKKERELSVLRSSLKVDENDAGYISDDASEGEDDENDTTMSPARLNGYGPAETEALATLMAAGGTVLNGESPGGTSQTFQLVAEKEKALKDLQTERENLANAKLIISSLEKANKSMMEDLRSRLQDSNTAIASLLDKSMEHEKSSTELKQEVEKIRKEKDELETKHQEEMRKMKDETKVYSLRIASKERELHDLKKSEEKKDDADDI